VELEDVLACDDEVLEEVFQFIDPPLNTVIRLPQMFLAQLRHELGWFLHLVYDYGIPVFYWAHHQFADAVRKRYLLRCTCQFVHFVLSSGETGPELAQTEFLAPQNCHLALLGPHLLRSCRNVGLWLPELCSELQRSLNSETVSANLAAV